MRPAGGSSCAEAAANSLHGSPLRARRLVAIGRTATLANTSPQQEQHQAFYLRGEEAWQEYLRTGVAAPAEAVFARINEMVDRRRRKLAGQALSCSAADRVRPPRP